MHYLYFFSPCPPAATGRLPGGGATALLPCPPALPLALPLPLPLGGGAC